MVLRLRRRASALATIGAVSIGMVLICEGVPTYVCLRMQTFLASRGESTLLLNTPWEPIRPVYSLGRADSIAYLVVLVVGLAELLLVCVSCFAVFGRTSLRLPVLLVWRNAVAIWALPSIAISCVVGVLINSPSLVDGRTSLLSIIHTGFYIANVIGFAGCCTWRLGKLARRGKGLLGRCPACGYLLYGQAESRCPECGRAPVASRAAVSHAHK